LRRDRFALMAKHDYCWGEFVFALSRYEMARERERKAQSPAEAMRI
jgi:hypothetical protein